MSISTPRPEEFQPFGLPVGSVRGILSLMICSFFWILLLVPWDTQPLPTAPLAHFFLLTLVFLAFASHHVQEVRESALFPWVMRVLFVGGSIAVVIYMAIKDPTRLGYQLTPSIAELPQWPVLLGCLAGGFGASLFLRSVLGRGNPFFYSIRAWIGVIAFFLLFAETIFQFAILPKLSDRPSFQAMQIWEGMLIASVAAYFGSRA
ncbi:MAG: hypothetical protein C0467_15430 [Planctomycetaceae bacterium]|nr:hypothetical protein [Planctomycetaceae bacterium]